MLSKALALSALPALIRAASPITVGYFAGFHADDFTVGDIPWDKYDVVNYAFAETASDVSSLELINQTYIPEFVTAAHANNVKAVISLGGWTGSIFFSSAVATAENRTTFVKTVTDLAVQWDFDGLDFDWEYPNRQGLGCNTISPNDTSNYLLFLQELRQDPIGASLLITAAVGINPFNDENGTPGTDVSAFGELFDFVTVMNYDLWGSWSTGVGPNGALNDTCAAPANQQGSAVHAVNKWTGAGFPANKLVLGLPAYGHSFSVTPEDAFNGTETIVPYTKFNASVHPVGGPWDDPAGVDKCGVATAQGGVITFAALIGAGYLDESGEVVDGVPYVWDECSQTPFLYNATTEVMISFDNAQSFAAKGQFARDSGLAGYALWEVGGDYNSILVSAARGDSASY
ncbi:glycoside hydrolase [Cylindrobasidium torrendii FP15055 ss-10]|uniref:Glycoside hydrolase n=1 Tax=Cylindrobasidium torrendii FP15055 ss-10 TaxID=1314674 RepID=A0A0D7B2S9_9AGAR|nr:glycoside hydrolase [Cylindrobasidium torrendii FP15055 ss-10]